MKDEKIQIPEDRAKLYETMTGSKPSDKVEIKNSAEQPQFNPKKQTSDSQTVVNSICLILRWIACLLPLFAFILNTIDFSKMYFNANNLTIGFTFSEGISLGFNFFLKILTIFGVYAIFGLVLVVGINIVEFVVYSIMILIALYQKNKAEKEFKYAHESIKQKLDEMDKKDEEKKKADKSVDFSNID